MGFNEVDAGNLESVKKTTGKRKIHTASDAHKKGAKKGAKKLKKKTNEPKRFEK